MIDLRSDTVTKPTKAMLKTMFEANIGDDVFGEDPTVIALEEKLADMFGMEAGLFCPSGTMTNQIAIKCLTQPLEEIILDQTAHVYRYEGGGIMFNSNASVRLLNGERGKITAEMIASEINPDGIYYPKSSLVVLENTVNKGGGICYTLEEIKPIHQLCKQKDLKLHLDGARIFNALSFTKDKAVEYGEYFDSISVCLSKGLGAPVGSVLLANRDTINYARRVRKVMGGGMRQSGFLAAAGIYALDHHIERLEEDHIHAKMLGDALLELDYIATVLPVFTNIVLFKTNPKISSDDLVAKLTNHGLLCSLMDSETVRFVTHLDINKSQIIKAIEILKNLEANA